MKGTRRLENPDSWFYVDVTEANGTVTRWGFEGNTPTSLIRAGYKRDAVKAGDKVTIRESRARGGEDVRRREGADPAVGRQEDVPPCAVRPGDGGDAHRR